MKNQKFTKRFQFASQGIAHAFKSEASFRTQCVMAIGVWLFLGLTQASPQWWPILSLCIGLVLAGELMNTALEKFIDHMHPDQHPAVGLAKDCAAGAVLMSSLISVLAFAFYLVDRFAHLL